MDEERQKLRYRVWTLYNKYGLNYCPGCHKKLGPNDGHLHEWCVKRSAKGKRKQEEIFQPWNCILVCTECHLSLGQTKLFKAACRSLAEQIPEFEPWIKGSK